MLRHGGNNFASDRAAAQITAELHDVWEAANIPTVSIPTIKKKVVKLIDLFKKVHKLKESEKKDMKWFQRLYEELAKDMPELFDLKAGDAYIEANAKNFQVPYGKKEQELYLDQKNKVFSVALGGVDKKWLQEEEVKKEKQDRKEAKRQRLEERQEQWIQEKASTGIATAEEVDAAIGMEPPSEVTCEKESALANSHTDFERYVMTRDRKRRIDESGDVVTEKQFDLRVRHSFTMVRDCVYDYLIHFMSEGSASNRQAVLSAKLFVKHMFNVDWYLQEEAVEQKKKAEENGSTLPDDFYLHVLPSDTALDRMRTQYARATQKSIGELILGLNEETTVTQHGDSTTRSMTGKIFTTPLTVGENLHLSLPVQKLSFETKNDVAEVFKVQYDMLGALTKQPASLFFEKMTAFMTDSASEMNLFLSILGKDMDSNHVPHHLKCVLHTALGFTETEIKVVSSLEQTIGPDKLYGTANCHDSSNVSKSTVMAILKLISPQYQHKPYNLKSEFDATLSDGTRKNDSFSLRSHRFGALEKASAVVIYHWDDVLNLCDRVENRNDLIIFCRTTMDCSFIKNVILCFALFGIFLIEPFRELVSSSNHHDLCQIFPILFSDLQKHEHVANGILEFSSTAIPSLESPFKKVVEKKVYANRWLESLQEEINRLDDNGVETVRNLLGLFAHHCSITLRRQRGEEYGFAAASPEPDSIPGKKRVT